jgi:AraC family transcriptional activator of pobA
MERIPIRHLGTTQAEPDLFGNFGIRRIADLLGGKDMLQELHRHDFFYILVLEKGKGHHEIDFRSYAIDDQVVFFMRPGQVHQIRLNADSTGYLIHFREEFYLPQDQNAGQLLRKLSQLNHYELNADHFPKLMRILLPVFQEYTDKQERYQEVIKANMGIFFIELLRAQNNRPADQVSLYNQERLEQLLSLLERHVFSHKQVAEYAAMLNLSTYQLNAITKTTLGKTCSELISEYLVLEAKRYLLATSSQVNQIAYSLGYGDVSYFIRFFKKYTGHSPEAFRQNFR